ncbi:SOS response-associated peptidase [Leeuwenhoekiella palythoae]|uniref:SOS response-associated peptidase n=1 Tax=Leeuwenhoekiella palythoae TaxID=573501 RepID=UPI00351659C8
MCNATSLTKLKEEIVKASKRKFVYPEVYEPYYHINGFGDKLLHIIPQDDAKRIWPADWKLIPDFHKGAPTDFKYNTLNARSEDIFTSNTYKKSAESGRCLILADGFFEPHTYVKPGTKTEKKQPYYITLPEQKLFFFAGLFNKLDEELYTVTILTLDANATMAQIHNAKKRMPLILDEQFTDSWIDPTLNEKQIKDLINVSFTNERLNYHPVSNAIYKRGVDTNKPEILKPVSAIDPEMDESRPTLF